MTSEETIKNILFALRKCNFDDLQIKRVLAKISYFHKGNGDLEKKITEYKNILTDKGLSESVAIDTIIENPRYIWSSIDTIKNNIESIIGTIHRKNSIVEDAIKNIEADNYNNDDVYNYLIKYGFSSNIINKDRKLGNILCCKGLEKIKRIIRFYELNGFSKEEIIKCGNKTLLFLINTEDFFVSWIRFFEIYNINCNEFMLMYKRNVHGFSYDEEHVLRVFSWFKNFGFDNEHIKEMIIKQPSILNPVNDVYTDKLNNLINSIGYTKEQVIKLVSKCPSILSNSKEKIIEKFKILLDYFELNTAIDITLRYPEYYSICIDNIKDKLDAIYDAEVIEEIINNPNNLIQSAQLTRERSWYMKSIFKIEDDYLYRKTLFAVKNVFERRMRIDSSTLSKMYANRYVKKLELKCEEE